MAHGSINGSQNSSQPAERSNGTSSQLLDVEHAVRERYSQAAAERTEALCCPVTYDREYLAVLPDEIIERDYGCGDPSPYLKPGETVLDLGSGCGKICYIAAQIVGEQGHVLGVDRNDDMLALARKYRRSIGEQLGYHNVDFHKGSIQDLGLDLEVFEDYLAKNAVASSSDWLRAEAEADRLRHAAPMIADNSIDVVVSNCVLNLVKKEDRRRLFAEVFRVLRRGGRAVISDITCDEPVPQHLQDDPRLWSGCISGAFQEREFLEVFAQAGFYGIEILARQENAWATVEGIEFRSMTVQAFKGKQGPCKDQQQAVIYTGPWKSVTDDDGHTLRRGERMAVCGKTFDIYAKQPYADDIIAVPPRETVAADEAPDFDCRRNAARSPQETKGLGFDETLLPTDGCCGPDCC